MHNHHNRTVNVDKNKLIEKIKANKEKHIKDYEEAVIAYRKEATAQLEKQSQRLAEGKMDLSLHLVTPINAASDYDKVVEMFEWEKNDIVTLTQKEFNEYIHDETSYALAAKFSNSTYLGK
jgi:hypothetical protein